jgi:alpha-tubulin suppressor-like RCC1 family protein
LQTVTLTAWPRGGAPPCSVGVPEYRFLYRAPNGAETVIRDYAAERLGTFQIATPLAGTYQLVAQVRAQGSASPFQTEATVSATLGYACSIWYFVPEAQRLEDPLVRVTVSWECAAGTAELLPFYRAVGDDDWTALPSVLPSGSSQWGLVTWDTTGLEPGQYELRVDVRAAGHEISGSATSVIALCAPGLLRNAAGECVDVDECTVLPGRYGCDPATRCTNTLGSHVCGPCPADYAGDAESGCVQTSEQYIAVATGGFGRDYSRHPWEGHICALRADGTLRCWGRNSEKQSEVPAGTYTAVTAGAAHTCALEIDGSATCWGSNDAGQAAPPAGVFTELAAGVQHTCGLRPDGSIVCWGANDYAQSTPPAGAFRALAAGERHSCALSEQGQLSCWGGSLGAPTVLPGTFESVAAGPWETCAIHEDGTLQCWNFRDGGSAAPYPTDVKFERIAVGAPLTCGVLEGGSLRCWNAGYQNAHNTPRGTFESVVAGGAHACALDGDGHLRCWSEEYWDASVAGGTFEAISGTWYMCRLHASGEMSCWGSNLYGDAEAPEGTFTSIEGHCGLRADGFVRCGREGIQPLSEPLARLIPSNDNLCGLRADGTLLCADTQHAMPPSGPFLDAFAARTGGCGIRPDNTVECWGLNLFGEATPPAGEFASLSGGVYYMSCGVRVDGTLACWGYDTHGQRTPPPGQFRSVTVGSEHACAIREDETVACWGDDSVGQATPPPGTFRMLALSRWFSCGLRTDGTEACWGAVLR